MSEENGQPKDDRLEKTRNAAGLFVTAGVSLLHFHEKGSEPDHQYAQTKLREILADAGVGTNVKTIEDAYNVVRATIHHVQRTLFEEHGDDV